MFLTSDQVYQLTGKHRYAAQVRALRSMLVPHRIRPDGKPLVIESDLVLSSKKKQITPDFEAL